MRLEADAEFEARVARPALARARAGLGSAAVLDAIEGRPKASAASLTATPVAAPVSQRALTLSMVDLPSVVID